MADIHPEKTLESGSDDYGSQREEIFERPTGWKGIYYHPYFQVSMLGFVCFMCPGMFNALGGIGGGGQVNTTAQSNASTATYATFAFFAFFSGSVSLFHVMRAITDPPQNDQQCAWTSTNPVPRNTRILPVYCLVPVRTLRCNHNRYKHSLIYSLGWIIFTLMHTTSSSSRVLFLDVVQGCYGPHKVV